MCDFRLLAMDEYLKDLAAKRKILEQKCQIRQVTTAEFKALRTETVRNAERRVGSTNALAHQRNVKILEDMSTSMHLSSTRALMENAALRSSESQLNSAREAYLRTAGQMLPAWRSYRSDMQLHEAAQLRQQRLEIEQNRQRKLLDAEDEMKSALTLEEERRQYLLAVALQNRENDYINCQAKSLLAESRAVDYLMQKEVEKHEKQARSRDSQVLHQMRSRLNEAMDATSAAGDGHTDAAQALLAYQNALTSPALIAKALREAPLPIPIEVDKEDLDVTQVRRRVTIRSEAAQDRTATTVIERRHPQAAERNDEPALISPVHKQTGPTPGYTNKLPNRHHRHLSINTAYSDDDSDGSGVVVLDDERGEAPSPTRTNRRMLTPHSSFERPATHPMVSVSDAIDSPEFTPSNIDDVEHATAASSKVRSPLNSADSRQVNISGMELYPLNSKTEPHSESLLLTEAISTSERIELFDRLCRRLEILDDVSRERVVNETNHRLRRDEQFLTAIQAYRKAGRSVMGFSASTDMPASTNQSIKNDVQDYLHDLCKAVVDGRERETALYGIEAVAEAILHLTVEIGPYLLPSEILNGVITEDKVHRNMRRLGGGRMELWRALTIHLKGIVASGGAKAEELSRIFTAALVLHVSRGDEQHRAERKIRTLIQLEVMPKTPEPSDSIADSSFSISMNETKPLGDISVSDNIAPPPVIVTSEPAKRLSSPRSSVSTAAKVSTPTQDPIVRKKALEALGGVDDSYDPPMDTAVQQNNLPMQRYNSTLTESGAASLPVLSGATDTTRSSNLMGRHSLEVVSSSSGVKPEKATSDVNTSMTSSVPQASKFSSTSNQAPKGAPVAKKWSNVNNMMSIEDDELVSDDDAIAAPPPTKLLADNESDSNEFDF